MRNGYEGRSGREKRIELILLLAISNFEDAAGESGEEKRVVLTGKTEYIRSERFTIPDVLRLVLKASE